MLSEGHRLSALTVILSTIMATNSRGPAIGIDLGTSYSCVAVWQKDHVEIISNEQVNRITPSYVVFDKGERLVGDAAKHQVCRNPLNTIFGKFLKME